MAGKRPVAAILYDFDRTLCTKDMQEYQFIPSVGMEPADFWGLANSYAEEEHMDKILSYMYIMIKKIAGVRDSADAQKRHGVRTRDRAV